MLVVVCQHHGLDSVDKLLLESLSFSVVAKNTVCKHDCTIGIFTIVYN